jgi:phosphoribosylaminoimidazole carboxylase
VPYCVLLFVVGTGSRDCFITQKSCNDALWHAFTCSALATQDKFAQKEHFTSKGIPGAPYMKTDTVEELLAAGKKMGYPMMLKARGNSYDGKGNYVVKTAADADIAFKTLSATSDRGCYAEGWAEFTMELAVMVVRGVNDEV